MKTKLTFHFEKLAVRLLATLAGTLLFSACLSEPVKAAETIGCFIQPDDMVQVSTPVAGIVSEILVQRGDTVAQGQILARLDTEVDQISFDLAQARAEDQSTIEARQARLEFLEAQAARLTELADKKTVSPVARDEAISEARVARFELSEAQAAQALLGLEARRAKALMDQKTLRSPVNGIVTEQLLSPGEYQDGQTHIATIAKMDLLRIEAFASLDFFDQIDVGQTVTITPEAPIGGAYEATVTVIDQVFDAASATFGLEMKLDNSDAGLPAGLRCTVSF